ncbi:unnamed protein product [Prorocentrum cordatum]|uniref:RNase H type-1 domain-containing protein n=1 Tax=Prorocentrum cordatum TaxID=2364126 RepID=A0ABN9Y4Y6_9DINO|nr:unnamed protein product [Polarella glacialis]
MRQPWRAVWPWREQWRRSGGQQQLRGRKVYCQECCKWLFADRLEAESYTCKRASCSWGAEPPEGAGPPGGWDRDGGCWPILSAGAGTKNNKATSVGARTADGQRPLAELSLQQLLEAAAAKTEGKQKERLDALLAEAVLEPRFGLVRTELRRPRLRRQRPSDGGNVSEMSYGKPKLIWPPAVQRWQQRKTKSKRNFSDILSAVLQPPMQEVEVDMGNLFECSGDISESDKREIEQRKLAFVSAAKGAARAAFAAAAEKLRSWQARRLQRRGPWQKQWLLLVSAPRSAAPSSGFSHSVYMHNLSTWGPRLRKRISSSTDDIFIFPETHVGAGGINEILGHLDGKGWKAIVTPSRRSSRAGQAGGTSMAAKAHLSVQSLRHLAAKKEQAFGLRLVDADWSPGPIDFQDMVAITWRWKGHSVLVVGIYLTSSLGVKGENQMKLARLAAPVRGHDGPWVAAGDWNAEPSEIKQAGWLKVLGGVARAPEDVQYTCTRSTARMLDYAICSESFQRMIARVVSDQAGPGDHYGVRIHIRGETESENAVEVENFVAVRCSDVPVECRRVDQEMGDLFGGYESSAEDDEVSEHGEKKVETETKQSADEVFDIPENQRDEIWQLKIGQACGEGRRAWRTPPSCIADSAAYQFDPFGAEELGAQFGAWAHATEQCYLGMLKIEPTERRKHAGRGEAVSFASRVKRMSDNVASDADSTITWWGTLASYLVELQRCHDQGQRSQHLRRRIREMSSSMPSGGVVKMTSKQKRKWRTALAKAHSLGTEQLQALGAAALTAARKGKRVEVNEALIAHTNWVQAQGAVGSGKLHRRTRGKPRCDNEVRASDWTASNMVEYMDAKGAQWRKKWTSSYARAVVLEKLEVTRAAAVEEDWAPITLESLNSAIHSMGKSKAKGIEQMGALAYKWLPPSARVELLNATFSFRSQCTNEWASHMAGKWGAAVAGNSALKEALVRSFADEVLEWAPMKVFAATALWDLAEFYDTLEPLLILEEGLRLGLPARILHLEMLSHLSTGLVRERTAYAGPISPDRSICAGARRGIDFGRVALCATLEQACAKYQQVHVRSWAGDVTTRMEGSRREVIKQPTGAGVDFAAGARRARLTLSSKSTLIGNDMDVVKEVALRLRSRNIAVKVKGQAPDLGTDRGRSIGGGKGKRAKRAAHADRQVAKALKMHALDDDVDLSDLKAAIKSTIGVKQWARAAQHFAGGGLEGGADLRSAKMKIGKLRRKGQCDKVGAFLAIMTGAVWPRQRVADLGIEIEDVMCPGRGEVPETWKHRMWDCRCNETIEGIEKSQHLVVRASTEVENQPCLWLRGLIPASWTSVSGPPEPGTELIESFGDLQVLSSSTECMTGGWLIAAGGASGGEYTLDPRLRKVSWGWVVFDSVDPPVAKVVVGSRGALAGWRQSVNRGELMALKDVSIAAGRHYDKIRYTADSSYVVRGMGKLRGGWMPKTHVDLWKEVKQGIIGKQVEIIKVESHMSAQEALDAEVNPIDWLGNVLADDFVDGIAEAAQVPRAQARSVGFAEGAAGLVRDRAYLTPMASIEAEPSQVPSLKIRQEAHVKACRRAALLEGTKHNVTHDVSGKHYRCLRCGSRALMSSADAWLAGECVAVQKADAVHGSLRSRPRIANQEAHESHIVLYVEELGLHYCKKCGCIARESMRKLVQVCEETPGQMGKQNLLRIAKGLQPGTSAMALACNKKKKKSGGS